MCLQFAFYIRYTHTPAPDLQIKFAWETSIRSFSFVSIVISIDVVSNCPKHFNFFWSELGSLHVCRIQISSLIDPFEFQYLACGLVIMCNKDGYNSPPCSTFSLIFGKYLLIEQHISMLSFLWTIYLWVTQFNINRIQLSCNSKYYLFFFSFVSRFQRRNCRIQEY